NRSRIDSAGGYVKAALCRGPAACPASRLGKWAECLTQSVSILVGKIDLVRRAVQAEAHCLIGFAAVDVVVQHNQCLSGHATKISACFKTMWHDDMLLIHRNLTKAVRLSTRASGNRLIP